MACLVGGVGVSACCTVGHGALALWCMMLTAGVSFRNPNLHYSVVHAIVATTVTSPYVTINLRLPLMLP